MRRLVLRLSLPLCWSFSHLCSLCLAFCCSIYLVGPCQVSFFVLYFGLCSHLYFAHPCPHLRYQLLSFLSALCSAFPLTWVTESSRFGSTHLLHSPLMTPCQLGDCCFPFALCSQRVSV